MDPDDDLPPPQPVRDPADGSACWLASVVVIATKETRLGLDLKGGVELVYQGEPTPQSEVTPEAIDRVDRHHPRARRPAGRRRARDPAPRQRPDLGRPAGRQEPRARQEAGRHDRPALLLRLGEERHRQPAARRSPASTTAVKRASPAPAARSTATTRPRASTTCSSRTSSSPPGPDSSRKDLLSEFDGRVPEGLRAAEGAAGHRRAARGAARTASRATSPSTATSCVRDNPELQGHRHQEPASRSTTRTTRRADRHLRVHRQGPQGTSRTSRKRLAERGQTAPGPGPAGRELVPDLRDRARPRGRLAARSSTTARTRTASTAAPARRSRAASSSRRRRTSRTS